MVRLGKGKRSVIRRAFRGLRRVGLSPSLAKTGANNVGKALYQKTTRRNNTRRSRNRNRNRNRYRSGVKNLRKRWNRRR